MSIPKQHSQLQDDELIHHYRTTGNNDWLGCLLQRYTALLFGVAMKYLKDNAKAQDAIQQIFLKVLTCLPKENIHNFKGWLYILMRNHCLHELRGNKTTGNDLVLSMIADTESGTEDILLQNQSEEQLEIAIGMLQPEQKDCIKLFYFKMYSYDQIIKATGYTFMQVKSYIQNGKRNLKNILSKQQPYNSQ